MVTHPARTLFVSIDRPFAEVYAYASDPANLVHWAPGLGSDFTQQGEFWVLRQAGVTLRLRFTSANAFGVLDHDVFTPTGVVHVAMRAMPNGDGAVVTFLLLQTPDLDDAAFARDAAAVQADLDRLKAILERRAQTP